MTEEWQVQRSATDEAALAARLERLPQRPRAGGPPTSRAAEGRPVRKTGRRHPAQGARYAAIGFSILSTAGLTSVFLNDSPGSASTGVATIVSGGANPTPTVPGGSSGGSISTSSPTAAATGSTTVVDGAVAHNRWGDVQVEATFAPDGSLNSVDAIQTPGGRGTSIEINGYAVPLLDADAIAQQSAQVHTVSGATYTSDSYRSSLQSAIDAARANGATTLS